MKNNLFILLFCGICLFGVNSCADVTTTKKVDYSSFSAITGLSFVDANGSPIGTWKAPNQKPGNASIYPIPGNGTVSFLGDTAEEFTKVWVTPASCITDTINENIPGLSLSIEVDLDEVEEIALAEYNVSGNVITLDISNLGQGFYKILYTTSTSTEIFWTNYYLDPNFSGGPDITLLDMECN